MQEQRQGEGGIRLVHVFPGGTTMKGKPPPSYCTVLV